MNYEVRINDQIIKLELDIKKKGDLTEDAVVNVIQQLIGENYEILQKLTKHGIIYIIMTWTLQHVNKEFPSNVDSYMKELYQLLQMQAYHIIIHKGSFDW